MPPRERAARSARPPGRGGAPRRPAARAPPPAQLAATIPDSSIWNAGPRANRSRMSSRCARVCSSSSRQAAGTGWPRPGGRRGGPPVLNGRVPPGGWAGLAAWRRAERMGWLRGTTRAAMVPDDGQREMFGRPARNSSTSSQVTSTSSAGPRGPSASTARSPACRRHASATSTHAAFSPPMAAKTSSPSISGWAGRLRRPSSQRTGCNAVPHGIRVSSAGRARHQGPEDAADAADAGGPPGRPVMALPTRTVADGHSPGWPAG